ncbi:DUF6787 family protein [Rapidithrix thailandica]|uniref:DUF6787 family protein n=1 Tax=Rapidithrix thailandica TaxID=413964 RepID=A0AAW9SES5_9BACT
MEREETLNSTTDNQTGVIKVFNRLKDKWGVDSLFQVFLILLVFSATGSTVVLIRGWLFDFLGFGEHTAFWLKTVAYLAFVMPAYQILLLVYGTMLGQFSFFWEKEKKLFRLIKKLFIR